MKRKASKASPANGPPEQYQTAMADIEERAARGELSIADVKREIFALRERFAASPDMVMRWAAQAQADSSKPTEKPVLEGRAESSVGPDSTASPTDNPASAPSTQPA